MTINAQKGEVTLPLDIERRLRYDFNAIADLEAQVGMTVRKMLEMPDLGIYHLRALIWAGCLHEMPDLTVMQTTGLLDRMYGMSAEQVEQAVSITLDRPRAIRFDTFALISLELELNLPFTVIAALDMDGIREVRALLWAGLLHEQPTLTLRDAGALLSSENMDAVRMACAGAMLAAFANVPERTIEAIRTAIEGLRLALRGPEGTLDEASEDDAEKKVTTMAPTST